MINTIRHRESEKALQLGKLYTPDEALQVNLVDELIEAENLLARAEKIAIEWSKVPAIARMSTKKMMRERTLNGLKSRRDDDLNQFVESTMDPNLQIALEKYLSSLKNKKKQK